MKDGAGFLALVLAGQRPGPNVVADAGGKSHKAFVRVAGVSMLERVLRTLEASERITLVALCIEPDAPLATEAPEVARRAAAGEFRLVSPGGTPSASVLAAFEQDAVSPPLVVTTADHPLLQPAMVDRFCREAAAAGADAAFGLAPLRLVDARYPGTRRTRMRFRDGDYCGCNLFALLTEKSRRAPRVWNEIEMQRKTPWRMARILGAGTLARYLTGALSLEQAAARLSRRFGLEVAAVELPYAEAAIDVDRLEDLALVERILADCGEIGAV